MRQIIYLAISFFAYMGADAQASTLSSCYNPTNDVSLFFTTCVRGNFSSVAQKTGLDLGDCYNYTSKINYFFTSCVRSNFEKIGQRLQLNLSSCMNPGTNVSYFFTICLRNNFTAIDEALSKQSDNGNLELQPTNFVEEAGAR